MQTSIHAIAQAARRDKRKRFQSLYSVLNRETLAQAYHSLNKDASPGVDRVTYEEYGKNLQVNLEGLEKRLKEKTYHAKLVSRKEIPKGDGKTRPIGILVLEDKLCQRVARDVLQALYEPLFYEHNYGYRPGCSAKQAVDVVWDKTMVKCQTVVEVDIKSFFDTINHDILIRMVEKRVDDRAFVSLIKQWLRAGIIHIDGWVEHPEQGTPQGGVISPMLANIYLHYVLDDWFVRVIVSQSRGRVTLVRYADDFVAIFQYQADADRYFGLLRQRFTEFGLSMSEEKTRMIKFSRFDIENNESFDFLGFTFFWGKSRVGTHVVMVRTSKKRICKTLNAMKEWIKDNRNKPVPWIIEKVKAKLRGHKNYFGRRGNSDRLQRVYYGVKCLLFKWLNRRSQRKSYNWQGFDDMLQFFRLNKSVNLGNNGVQMSLLPLLR
jgi:RNA-directed DNA polymerase